VDGRSHPPAPRHAHGWA